MSATDKSRKSTRALSTSPRPVLASGASMPRRIGQQRWRGSGMSGHAWMSSFPGQRPLKSRLYICDSYGALMGEVAVLAALHYRDRTGKGQFIELSQSESIMRTMSWIWPYQHITGKGAMPAGNRDVSICPADTFRCADDTFLALAAPRPEEFRAYVSRWTGQNWLTPPDSRPPDSTAGGERHRDSQNHSRLGETKTPEEVEDLA